MKNLSSMKRFVCSVLAFTLVLTTVLMVPSANVSAASNKALCAKVSFNGKKSTDNSNWMKNTYDFHAGYTGTTKLTTNMKTSYMVYVPTSAIKQNNDSVRIRPYLIISKNGGMEYVGSVNASQTIILRKQSGKVIVKRFDENKCREYSASSYASVKKSGNYYVVSLKNIPFEKKYMNNQGKKVSINTKTKYTTIFGSAITGFCTKTSDNVYLDNLEIKAASTKKITFDKKNYQFYDCAHNGGNYKCSVKTVK